MPEPKLDARQRSHVRRAVARATAEPEPGELQIVPLLDILVNLVSFLLVILATPLLLAQVEAQLPSYGPPRPAPWRATVVLTEQGIFVGDAAGTYAAGCATRGAGPTLPRQGRALDLSGLRYCAEQLHRAHPETTAITLAAEPGIELQTLLSAMDALQANGRLFGDVTLAAGVR